MRSSPQRWYSCTTTPKCISHYPGAYHALAGSGRTVLLVAELDGTGPAGGYDGGVSMARRALSDARSIGYPDRLPIFFCSDEGLVPGVTDPNPAWADGVYGKLNRQAVLRFQASAGLRPSGDIGSADWARLLS